MRSVVLVVSFVLTLAWIGPVMAQESLEAPDVTATGVYAFDPNTGEVILDYNSSERLAIGSVTKVMTALVVIDHLSLDDEVVILGDDMVPDGYSSMMLQPGDTLTVAQLLTGAMVVSGGDAANALARTVGADLSGSDDPATAVGAFVDAMNQRAADLGLNDTQFANPDGMDSDDAWSSARDVAVLFAAFMENPDLAEFAGTDSYSFTSVGPEATPYEGFTTNQLLGQMGVTAGKTGSETNAGGCVVLAREGAGGATEIVAVLGADLEYDEAWNPLVDARWDDAAAVMDLIDAEWTPGQFLAAEDEASGQSEEANSTSEDSAAAPPEQAADTEDSTTDAPPIGFAGQATEAAPSDTDDTSTSDDTVAVSTAIDVVPATTEASDPDTGDSSTKPIVVATVTGGVLALAAAYSWVRGGRSIAA